MGHTTLALERLRPGANARAPLSHSLGLLYSAFTAYLGFEVNEGEYKVMGMARTVSQNMWIACVRSSRRRKTAASDWTCAPGVPARVRTYGVRSKNYLALRAQPNRTSTRTTRTSREHPARHRRGNGWRGRRGASSVRLRESLPRRWRRLNVLANAAFCAKADSATCGSNPRQATPVAASVPRHFVSHSAGSREPPLHDHCLYGAVVFLGRNSWLSGREGIAYTRIDRRILLRQSRDCSPTTM